jgi:hypothetical protein
VLKGAKVHERRSAIAVAELGTMVVMLWRNAKLEKAILRRKFQKAIIIGKPHS